MRALGWAALCLAMVLGGRAGAACVGDCDGNELVPVSELIVGVNIALGRAPVSRCTAFDADGNDRVTVSELITAVGAALRGCAGAMATPTRTQGGGATPTPTPTIGGGTSGRLVFINTSFTTFTSDLVVINEDGSGRTNLTNTEQQSETQPRWSPDGTQVLFVTDLMTIERVNADGSGRAPVLANDKRTGYPSWSPDGTRVVFVGNDFKSIEIVDVDGSDRVPVLDDGFEYLSPCFSPDGEQIYFLSNRDVATNEVYVVGVDGSGLTRLTNDALGDSHLDCAATGRLAFNSAGGLVFLDPDTGRSDPINNSDFPGFNADGSRLALTTFGEIAVIDADGSGLHAVLNTTFDDAAPDLF